MGHSPNRLEQQPVKLKVPGLSPGCPARGLLFVSFIRPMINLVETNIFIPDCSNNRSMDIYVNTLSYSLSSWNKYSDIYSI